jgi:hypothetical protein
MRKALALPLALLALAGCQQQKPHAGSAGTAQGENVLRETLAKAKAAAPAGQTGVTQISTSGSVRGFALKLPSPHADANGRSLTVSLPFRPKDGLVWSVDAPGAPWTLTGSKTSPGAGPDGTDLMVFSFQASGPGSGALNFKLNPPKTAAGESVMSYQATVVAP